MSLFADWQHVTDQASQASGDVYAGFWQEYFAAETENYRKILASGDPSLSGTIKDLAARFSMEPMVFTGFLDGINTSLTEELDLDTLEEDSTIDAKIDFEKLYFNMHAAKASWLYGLKEWDGILTEERRKEITKDYRASVVFVKEKTVGRNDPCPCGSGKKYKKCCGKNL